MKQAINFILFLILLSVIAAMLFMPLAHATGQPATTGSSASAQANASAKAGATSSSALDLSLATNPIQSYRGGETYALASPAAAAPLPSGLCPKGDSESFSIIWGLVSWAKSSTRTEMECLDKVLAMLRDTAPKPTVINYLQPSAPKSATEVPKEQMPVCVPAQKELNPAAPKKHVTAPKVCK